MRFAYADPPYEGQASKYQREAKANGRRAAEVDHPALIEQLLTEFPDGWALSCKTGSLRGLLPLCPEKVRVCAWAKPFVPAYRGIRPVYSWEPVILVGGRVGEKIVRDSLVASNRQGLKPRRTTAPLGSKSVTFCRWVADLLGYIEGDEMVDLFPGSGVMGGVIDQGVLL